MFDFLSPILSSKVSGDFVRLVISLGGGLCPGGFCPGDYVQGGLCPEGFCPSPLRATARHRRKLEPLLCFNANANTGQ